MSEGGNDIDEDVTGFSGGEDEEAEAEDGFGTEEVESTTLSRAAMSPDLSTMKSNSSIKKTDPVDTDDLAELEDLTDNILCECLDARYKANHIYVSCRKSLSLASPFFKKKNSTSRDDSIFKKTKSVNSCTGRGGCYRRVVFSRALWWISNPSLSTLYFNIARSLSFLFFLFFSHHTLPTPPPKNEILQ